MSDIPLADLAAFGVITACAILSSMRGVIAEAGSLASWIVAYIFAKAFAVPFSETAFHSVQPRALSLVLAFVSLFFIAWLVQKFIRSLLTNAVSAVGLGAVNRILGGLFGAAKGVLILTLAVMVAARTDLPDTEEWQSSYSIPYLQSFSEVIMPHLPKLGGQVSGQAES